MGIKLKNSELKQCDSLVDIFIHVNLLIKYHVIVEMHVFLKKLLLDDSYSDLWVLPCEIALA